MLNIGINTNGTTEDNINKNKKIGSRWEVVKKVGFNLYLYATILSEIRFFDDYVVQHVILLHVKCSSNPARDLTGLKQKKNIIENNETVFNVNFPD